VRLDTPLKAICCIVAVVGLEGLHIVKLAHINIVARNADRLATFYVDVLGCEILRKPKLLTGAKVSQGNGLQGSDIYSIWLKFPGCTEPFLEIHEHSLKLDRHPPCVNEPGFGHLSFQVIDIHEMLAAIVGSGGKKLGEVTNFGTEERPFLIVYTRDLEGNIIELEQPSM